jgi:aminopeptidase N
MARNLSDLQATSARAVTRIDNVAVLRAAQFPEDNGPMAHPIRPESYQEIGNFYTATVYEKGAEVIRMQHTLLGEKGFRSGMDEYFRRHDGQAVTCDAFVDAMESIFTNQHPGRDLSVFRRWYRQAGTPRVHVTLEYDAVNARCTITLAQRCAPVGVEKRAQNDYVKLPFHIPFAIGLLDQSGTALTVSIDGKTSNTALLELTTERQQWVIENVPSRPIPSLLRDFSAPVVVEYAWSDDELALLSARDSNPFARWEAGQELATRQILNVLEQLHSGKAVTIDSAFIAAWRALLDDPHLDSGYRSRALALPSEKTLAERMETIDPPALARARDSVREALGRALASQWRDAIASNQTPGAYLPAPEPAGKRALKNLALNYLLAGGDKPALAIARDQYRQSTNMTDRLGALGALVNYGDGSDASMALDDFYRRWKNDALVMDKWFTLQATARTTDVAGVRTLMAHPAFNLRNPNRARSLVFQFCLNNPRGVHQADGDGYAYWADQVLALDALNPEIAARLARAFDNWSRFAPGLRTPMEAALTRVRAHEGLSRNVFEIVSKALEFSA